MKMNTPKGRLTTSKRLKARHLIVVLGYTQKEASIVIGISQKTMCLWAQKYNWKDQISKDYEYKGGFKVIMEGFFAYVANNTNQPMSEDLKALWNNYIEPMNSMPLRD